MIILVSAVHWSINIRPGLGHSVPARYRYPCLVSTLYRHRCSSVAIRYFSNLLNPENRTIESQAVAPILSE
ncbi:hypothetical protein RRG08_059795 [Elysia crispata]|uniref:Uncharacterized protein n=1 Tax=Elysia crispata TaxID=231223 RepID=A0AAE1BF17_9GAST|nr:hypothetical protein RRG08_059795 [Elysia crispata]